MKTKPWELRLIRAIKYSIYIILFVYVAAGLIIGLWLETLILMQGLMMIIERLCRAFA
jgi:hypothetical protein